MNIIIDSRNTAVKLEISISSSTLENSETLLNGESSETIFNANYHTIIFHKVPFKNRFLFATITMGCPKLLSLLDFNHFVHRVRSPSRARIKMDS